MQTVRLVKVGRSLMVTIPRWFCAKLNLMRGDTVAVSIDGDGVKYVAITPRKVGVSTPALADRRVDRTAGESQE